MESNDFLYRQESYIDSDGRFTLRFHEYLDGLRRDSDTNSDSITTIETTITTDSIVISNKSANYTQTKKSERIFVDASGGDVTITLLSAASGTYCNVIKTDSSSNSVFVASSDSLNGQASQELKYEDESLEAGSSGTTWKVL